MQYQRCISVIIYPWPWYMYVCMILNPDAWCMMRGMVHASMMRNFSVTEGPTEKVILGDAYIHDACMHDAYTYAPWSLCICAWCINVWCIHPWSLILDYAACVCDAYIHDATEISWRTDKAILGVGYLHSTQHMTLVWSSSINCNVFCTTPLWTSRTAWRVLFAERRFGGDRC